ncbi:SAM-dependent methyltransferase [Aquitalea denitrificans]|uniref:SAM-dependent methyltransferase n=1 Tax=Aquitalea denitrificans TaxID=519081 RepID=UPI00135A55E7|nr:class I SAM-dependent methyltransferase [Aquitalea denitrificans]
MTTAADWERRYQEAGAEYLFGTTPNQYLASKKAGFHAGQRAICLADGEGRNSVWLAGLGLRVTAVEASATARKKAVQLAASRQLDVDFYQHDMLDDAWPPTALQGCHDWVVAIFMQFARPAQRDKQFADMMRLCRPGGRLLLLGYTPAQLALGTGGPSEIDQLYTLDLLRAAFAGCQIEELLEFQAELQEGLRHQGRSALIGMIARLPD